MKGKKSDPIFISQFIREAVQAGDETSPQMVERAKSIINQIDEELKGIEAKKIKRSKLLDVINSFEQSSIKDKTEEAKRLDFFKLQEPVICKEICQLLKKQISLPITYWKTFSNAIQYNYCIKQLLEINDVIRVNDQLKCGERFDDYMQFV